MIVERISVTGKVLLWKILFEVLLMLDITCSVLVQFANGMKNTKVVVAKTNKYSSVLNRKTIPDISQYHSVKFHENGMWFLWYCNVGVGAIIPYSNASFSSGLKRIREFKWARNIKITTIKTSLSSKRKKIEVYAH